MLNSLYQSALRAVTLLVLVSVAAVRVEASTDLQFSAPPVLISGTDHESGAVYRFANVANGFDAHVEVVSLDGVMLLSIDDNTTQPDTLKPVFKTLVEDGSATLAVSLIDTVYGTAGTIHTTVSVLGSGSIADSVSIHHVSDYTHELPTALELSADSKNTLSVRFGADTHHFDSEDSYTAVTATVFRIPSLTIEIQSAGSELLSGSILFKPVSYDVPVFHNMNDQPVAVDDLNYFEANQTLHVEAAVGLLANDSDFDLGVGDDLLSVSSFRVNSIEHTINTTAALEEGSVTIDSDGAYQFIPAVNYAGAVTPIDYTVIDGNGGSASGALSLVANTSRYDTRNVANAETISLVVDEDTNGDGFINRAELEGHIDVSVLLTDEVSLGDQVAVVSKNVSLSAVVDEYHLLERRLRFSFDPPVDGELLNFHATLSDSRNEVVSEATIVVRADLTAVGKPSATIIADEDDSGFLSAAEHNSEMTVHVTLPPGAAVNDIVYLDHGSGNQSVVLTPLNIAEGIVVFSVPVAAEGETLSVVASIVDEAENRSESGSDSVLVDTVSPPPPSVNTLLIADSTPTVTGEIPSDGDYLLAVVLNDITYVTDDSALDVSAGGQWQLTVPPSDALEDGVYDVTVILTDIAGNFSADETTDELIVDLIAPVITVDSIAPSSDAAPIIAGTSDSSDTGTVFIETELGKSLCSASTNQGAWSCSVKHQLVTGDNNLLAVAHDVAGNRARQAFVVQVVFTSDSDGDGIADDIESTADNDGDSVADYLDLDSDNDGITDLFEGMIDSDGDGIRDYLDPDSDNDGIDDSTEVTGTKMIAGDAVGVNGIPDIFESAPDSAFVFAPIDSDGDQLEDYRDLDSDNDGIPDLAEQAEYSGYEVQGLFDSDFDGKPNYIDLDSDQDGIPDIIEQQLVDIDSNGVLDDYVDLNLDGLHDQISIDQTARDLDGDGIGNFIDLDSDGDGRRDIVESGGQDVNADGRHDSLVDSNANGINDDVDTELTGGADADSDGIDDRYDADMNTGVDSDADGIIDAFDPDADGDGMVDSLAVQPESLSQVYAFQPLAAAGLSTGTGVLGGGCALVLDHDSAGYRYFDPLLSGLLLLAFCSLWRRPIGKKLFGGS